MICLRITVLASLLLAACGSTANAQSLAEIARQEAARRQAAPRGRVITNQDLKPVPPAGAPATTPPAGATLPPPPPLDGSAPAAGTGVSGTETGASGEAGTDETKDESYWRRRLAAARDGLARSEVFRDALEARIGALTLDFVNRDDPAQRDRVEADRLRAIAELGRVGKDIESFKADLAAITEEARRAGVPAGWVR